MEYCIVCHFNFNIWSTFAFMLVQRPALHWQLQVVHAFRSEHAGKGGSGMASGQAGKGLVVNCCTFYRVFAGCQMFEPSTVAVEPGGLDCCTLFVFFYLCTYVRIFQQNVDRLL